MFESNGFWTRSKNKKYFGEFSVISWKISCTVLLKMQKFRITIANFRICWNVFATIGMLKLNCSLEVIIIIKISLSENKIHLFIYLLLLITFSEKRTVFHSVEGGEIMYKSSFKNVWHFIKMNSAKIICLAKIMSAVIQIFK